MKLKSNGLTIAFLCMVSLPSLTHAATFRSEEIVLLARPEAVTAADANNALNSNDPLREIRNIAPNLTRRSSRPGHAAWKVCRRCNGTDWIATT